MKLELFTDIFTYKDSALLRMDPRVKIAMAALTLALVLFSEAVAFGFALFVSCLLAALWIGAPARLILLRFASPMSMALVIFVLKAFLTGKEPAFTVSLFSIELIATKEGIADGVLLAFRILGALGVIQFLSIVTPAHQIFRALLWYRFPAGWVEVAMLMYRYTFDLFEKAMDMGAAQKVRLGYSNAKRSLSSAGTLAGAVLLSSFDQSIRASDAMKARGFTGVIPFDSLHKPEVRDFVTAILFSSIIIALFILTRNI